MDSLDFLAQTVLMAVQQGKTDALENTANSTKENTVSFTSSAAIQATAAPRDEIVLKEDVLKAIAPRII